MKSHRIPGYNCTLKICLTTPIGLYFWLFILKNRKIGFPLEMDFCLRVSATVIALPKYRTWGLLF